MTTQHTVIVAHGREDLEIKLDNGANKGWRLVWLMESMHEQHKFHIVFAKDFEDD